MPATDPLTRINLRTTPQSEQADPRQVRNSAGGYAFQTSDEVAIHRFLTIGTTGGMYYVTEAELTKVNADIVLRCACDRGEWLVEQIVTISTAGRAPRQNPGIFALAAVAGLGDDNARKAALEAIPAVCRTGTTLFQFATYVEQFRGWGPALCKAVARWYLGKDIDQLAYQLVKYRQRNGWTHRDLLRLAHPDTDEQARKALFDWVCGRESDGDDEPTLVSAFRAAQKYDNAAEWVELIERHPLPWEALPDAALAEPKVWCALIEKGVPQTALLRQLPRLTRLGVLDGSTLQVVTTQLTDGERLRKARVHPVNVLVAQRTYAAGQGTSSSWEPVRQVVDALDAAFYAAYGAVEPAGKRTLLALDISESMSAGVLSPGSKPRGWGFTAAPGQLSCREASSALALVTMATEPQTEIVGFTTSLSRLDISPRRRLDDVVKYTAQLPMGRTDCAAPMVWAGQQRLDFDTIVVYTDSETWYGGIHPHQALRRYRDQVGHDVRLVVVGLAANQFTIADPSDAGMLDIAGLDSAVPNLIADFSRGTV